MMILTQEDVLSIITWKPDTFVMYGATKVEKQTYDVVLLKRVSIDMDLQKQTMLSFTWHADTQTYSDIMYSTHIIKENNDSNMPDTAREIEYFETPIELLALLKETHALLTEKRIGSFVQFENLYLENEITYVLQKWYRDYYQQHYKSPGSVKSQPTNTSTNILPTIWKRLKKLMRI